MSIYFPPSIEEWRQRMLTEWLNGAQLLFAESMTADNKCWMSRTTTSYALHSTSVINVCDQPLFFDEYSCTFSDTRFVRSVWRQNLNQSYLSPKFQVVVTEKPIHLSNHSSLPAYYLVSMHIHTNKYIRCSIVSGESDHSHSWAVLKLVKGLEIILLTCLAYTLVSKRLKVGRR